jgi:hypothetical protein
LEPLWDWFEAKSRDFASTARVSQNASETHLWPYLFIFIPERHFLGKLQLIGLVFSVIFYFYKMDPFRSFWVILRPGTWFPSSLITKTGPYALQRATNVLGGWG